MADKKADLAGPGTGDYLELAKVLPTDYNSLLSPKETQKALFATAKTISIRTHPKNGHLMHGLNGDILVWNPVTRRRHELSSMGIRVNAESLKKQLELTHQLDFLSTRITRGS